MFSFGFFIINIVFSYYQVFIYISFSVQRISIFYTNPIEFLNISTNLCTLRFGIAAVMASKSIVFVMGIQEITPKMILWKELFPWNPLRIYGVFIANQPNRAVSWTSQMHVKRIYTYTQAYKFIAYYSILYYSLFYTFLCKESDFDCLYVQFVYCLLFRFLLLFVCFILFVQLNNLHYFRFIHSLIFDF